MVSNLAATSRLITIAETFEHELLELFCDPLTVVTGVVAIHGTALGPAMGGLRIRRYRDLEAAAVDALRLARAMTLKNSAAGLHLGGGKAAVVDDGGRYDRERRLLAFADLVERLGGQHVTAEDVGTSPTDMDLIASRTRWVVGRSAATGGSGDPSPSKARNALGAIEAAARSHLGVGPLERVHVGVLGAGMVGRRLVSLPAQAGARVTIADVDYACTKACSVSNPTMTETAAVDGFLGLEMDVLAPCATGELIGEDDGGGLRCRIAAGGANNPLVDHATAVALHQAGILYVPDFIANCGGIVHVAAAEFPGLSEHAVEERLEASKARVSGLLEEARWRNALPLDVAVEHALARVEAARPVEHGSVPSPDRAVAALRSLGAVVAPCRGDRCVEGAN